jgi:outer membrane biosynthesis protein TonB
VATANRRDRASRLLPPSIGALVLALSASLSLHLPVYVGLGALAAWQKAQSPVGATKPSSVELELSVANPEVAVDTPVTQPPRPEPDLVPDEVGEEPQVPEPLARREARPEPDPEPEPEPELVPAVVPPPRPPPPRTTRQAVQQRSQDPSVEPPEDAQFIAEESSRVEEQTVAQLRNLRVDDPEQQAGVTQDESESVEPGNSDSEDVRDLRELDGSEDRAPTPAEAVAVRTPDRRQPLPRTEAAGDTAREGSARRPAAEGGEAGGDGAGARARGGGAEGRERVPEEETVVEERMVEVDDGFGAFRIAVRERPEGRGPAEAGGETVQGEGRGETGRERGRRGRLGRLGERGRGRGAGSTGPDLRVSWRQFEEVIGEEELREERERFVRERQARLRGSNRQEEWRRFRAAIENYVPHVRPGNQTALNAAASPFANYLAEVHRRIHEEYALGFLRGLPAGALSPYSDQSLMTELEIILNRDGSVHRVGVVRTSGLLPFDHGAYAAVMHAQPYPEPPSAILSGDGRVYFHWGFYRNHRQCGTFNAEPYVLPNPPGSAPQTDDPFRDGLTPGGVIPRGAQPYRGSPPAGQDDGMPRRPANDAVPNDAVPNDAVPNDAVPNDAVPNDAVPRGSSEGSSGLG